jgi:hypothetical protein
MPERLLCPGTLTLFALLALVANLSAASISAAARSPVAHWAVVSQPVRLVNGSPVLFRVSTPHRVRTLSGNWLGHEIAFSFDPASKMWFALAGVGQETKPGIYALELNAENLPGASIGDPISFEKKIRVERQRYPRVLLKVPARYTAPSPEDQHEIEQDKAIKAEAFKTVSDRARVEGILCASSRGGDLGCVWRGTCLQRIGPEYAPGARFPRAQRNFGRGCQSRTRHRGAATFF